ncbi:MAG: DinB family protein [Candidatus Acidiferrales bacterium]
MNYYGGKEMAASFRTVRKNTIQIATDIPEAKYDFKATPDTRTIAQTLAHIAYGSDFALHIHGNKIADLSNVNFPELFQKIFAEESKRRTKSELIALLQAQGDKFASYLEGLPESFLAETMAMPPGATPATRTRFDMLLSAKEHEMHHRGQLMVLERMVGVVPHLTRQREAQQAARAQAAQAQKT